jgi:TfoX/Sxy family transcriptional regulator of competence genes
MYMGPQAEAMGWPDVTARRMFGADCLLAKGRMFLIIMDDGFATKLPEDRYQRALEIPGVEPFTMRGTPFGKWVKFPASEAFALLPWLLVAYEHVLAEPPKRRTKKGGKRRLTPRKR